MKLTRKRMSLVVLGLAIGVFLFFWTGYVNSLQASLQGSSSHSAFIFGDADAYASKTRLLLKAVMLSSGYTIRRQPWNWQNASLWWFRSSEGTGGSFFLICRLSSCPMRIRRK